MHIKLKTFLIALILLAIHPGIICIVVAFGIELDLQGFAEDFAFASIYLPLIVPEKFGIVTLQNTPQMFSPPNSIGWLIISITWFLIYLAVTLTFAKLSHLLKNKNA